MSNRIEIKTKDNIAEAVSAIRNQQVISPKTTSEVREIIEAVREHGDEAILAMTQKYDRLKIKLENILVDDRRRKEAWENLAPEEKAAFMKAKERISAFAEASLSSEFEIEMSPGVSAGILLRPLDIVGLYIPGGRHPYPSTVLMTGIPAQVAGVKDIIFSIPPGEDGEINKFTLAATSLVENARVFMIGGAQAIAAMAFGTEAVPKCSLIAGPGNVYVTCAKRLVSNMVSIDLEAGPSEIAVMVDSSSNLGFAVSDILAQVEHDPLSIGVLVSDSDDVLVSAQALLKGLTQEIGFEEQLSNVYFVSCKAREIEYSFINALAPEHLELMVENARGVLGEIKNAGCVFLGDFSPAVMGDYIAGPSHVLPTGGAAARLSGLNVETFRKKLNFISYTEEGFKNDISQAKLMALVEGLERHAMSMEVRMRQPRR